MLKSAIACNKAGLTFASVHDSFWTHPSDVDVMNVVLREAFVRMHQGDLIQKLEMNFRKDIKDITIFAEHAKTVSYNTEIDTSDIVSEI